MAKNLKDKPLGYFGTLMGFVRAPRETANNVLRDNFRYFFVFHPLLLAIVLLAPYGYNLYATGFPIYHATIAIPLVIIGVLTFFFFVVFERCLLFLVRVKTSLAKVLAASCYSLSPFIVAAVIVYGISYGFTGNTMHLTVLPSGDAFENETAMGAAWWVWFFCKLYVFLTFYSCVRAFEDMYWANALVITIASIGPLMLAFFVAVVVGNFIYPDLINMYQTFQQAPESLLAV